LIDYDRKQELNVRRALLEDEINLRNIAARRNEVLEI
jgi:hypothetical protein